jgi:hypothetical protein
VSRSSASSTNLGSWGARTPRLTAACSVDVAGDHGLDLLHYRYRRRGLRGGPAYRIHVGPRADYCDRRAVVWRPWRTHARNPLAHERRRDAGRRRHRHAARWSGADPRVAARPLRVVAGRATSRTTACTASVRHPRAQACAGPRRIGTHADQAHDLEGIRRRNHARCHIFPGSWDGLRRRPQLQRDRTTAPLSPWSGAAVRGTACGTAAEGSPPAPRCACVARKIQPRRLLPSRWWLGAFRRDECTVAVKMQARCRHASLLYRAPQRASADASAPEVA